MPQSSDLTASGLLYEGNFDQWLPRMRAILAQHGCRLQADPSGSLKVHCGSCKATAKEVATVIWSHTSPNFSLRVPEEDRESPTALITALRDLARPFRLMDLPHSIWLPICLGSLTPCDFKEIRLLERPSDDGTSQQFKDTNQRIIEAPLLSVNRLIRLEHLTIYHLLTPYDLVFTKRCYSKRALLCVQQSPERCPRPTNAERISAINAWVSRSTLDSLTVLRKISFRLPLLAVCKVPREDMLNINLKIGHDWWELVVEEHPWLNSDSQLLLSDHATATSKLARSLKLQGQALIMFLTSRPNIWDQLELAEDCRYVSCFI